MLRWMFFEQYSHEPVIAVNRYILRYLAPDKRARVMDKIHENHRSGTHALAVMEQHLAVHDWLAVGRYTVADIALYAYTHVADEAGFDLAAYPAIRRWLTRVREQPKHGALMQESSRGPPGAFADDVRAPPPS